MISTSAFLIVIGVCALVGTHLFVMRCWLEGHVAARPVRIRRAARLVLSKREA
jgi:hypothetical protein